LSDQMLCARSANLYHSSPESKSLSETPEFHSVISILIAGEEFIRFSRREFTGSEFIRFSRSEFTQALSSSGSAAMSSHRLYDDPVE